MKNQKKSILVLAMILLTILPFLSVNVLGGESVIPPPPDKNKTLTANDGEPDGCNSSRFKCVMGGEAVLDKQTGLTWARNADLANGPKPWQEAVEFCKNLEIGNRKGWRLPTKGEFITILDTSQSNPVLPDGHPFNNLKKSRQTTSGFNDYWTGTNSEDNSDKAYNIAVGNGMVMDELKIFDFHIWPVLDGN
jgi:hypothetical protein